MDELRNGHDVLKIELFLLHFVNIRHRKWHLAVLATINVLPTLKIVNLKNTEIL